MTFYEQQEHFWLYQNREFVDRYLHDSGIIEIWQKAQFWQLFKENPEEAVNLIKKSHYNNEQKRQEFTKFIVESPQISCGIFADQRAGKDVTVNGIFEDAITHCKSKGQQPPRIVTLGNIKIPPYVSPQDRYFSFRRIPIGTPLQEVWIYCSEIETVLPAREVTSMENKLYSQLEGTMAQNHQKIFGCVKLASKVDLNFIRGMNAKVFKYITPEKLLIKGVERENILSDLAKKFIPNDRSNKSNTLLAFDNNIFTAQYHLPTWWTTEYSEQFSNVTEEDLQDYIIVCSENGMKPFSISTAIAQKFRVQTTEQQIKDLLGSQTRNKDEQ